MTVEQRAVLRRTDFQLPWYGRLWKMLRESAMGPVESAAGFVAFCMAIPPLVFADFYRSATSWRVIASYGVPRLLIGVVLLVGGGVQFYLGWAETTSYHPRLRLGLAIGAVVFWALLETGYVLARSHAAAVGVVFALLCIEFWIAARCGTVPR
jgi:hypothetical protein